MTITLSLNHLITATTCIPKIINTLSCISYQISRIFDSYPPTETLSKYNYSTTPPTTETTRKVKSTSTDHFSEKHISTPSQNSSYIETNSSSMKQIAPWASNFRYASQNRDLLNDPFNADLEHLVKVKIRRPLYQGEKIEMRTDEGTFKSYTIHRKIASEGLVSYALRPTDTNSDLSPIIVFRCTEIDPLKESAFASMQNDVDTHIGEKGWIGAKKSFEELMNDPTFSNPNQKIKVAGYSLGGAHAQYFIAEHHERVSHGIFYNNPSINPQIAEKFAQEIEQSNRDAPLILQIFRTQGDPFHHFGGKHLGCNVDHPNLSTQLLEVSIPNQYKFDTALHSKRIFDTQKFDYTVHEFTDPSILARKLDNSKRDPVSSFLEKLRLKLSRFLSGALNKIESFFDSMAQFFFRSSSSNRR